MRFQIVILSCALLSSCSMIQKIGLRSAGGVLQQASLKIHTEHNFQYFKDAAPANLMTLESMWYVDKENKKFMSALIKGYTGYAFGVSETLFLNDFYMDKAENSQYRKDAIYYYSKAIEYGMFYLKSEGIAWEDLVKNQFDIHAALDAAFDEDDHVAIFYLAQAMAGLMNLNRDDMYVVGQLPVAKSMIDWACKRDPDLEYGGCEMFYALFELSRPRMLGGNIEKGRERLAKLAKQFPTNYLLPVVAIQFDTVPQMDEDAFNSEAPKLLHKLEKWRSSFEYQNKVRANDYRINDSLFNLYNAIAFERLKIIKANKKAIF